MSKGCGDQIRKSRALEARVREAGPVEWQLRMMREASARQ